MIERYLSYSCLIIQSEKVKTKAGLDLILMIDTPSSSRMQSVKEGSSQPMGEVIIIILHDHICLLFCSRRLLLPPLLKYNAFSISSSNLTRSHDLGTWGACSRPVLACTDLEHSLDARGQGHAVPKHLHLCQLLTVTSSSGGSRPEAVLLIGRALLRDRHACMPTPGCGRGGCLCNSVASPQLQSLG